MAREALSLMPPAELPGKPHPNLRPVKERLAFGTPRRRLTEIDGAEKY
jgi:hypothetical protein